MTRSPLPVVVDLDGTLARVDTLHEQLVRLALRHPWRLLRALPTLLSSRAKFKAELFTLSSAYPISPPWNDLVIASLCEHRRAQVVLCTASNQAHASKLCTPLRLFSAIYGSDSHQNLKGKNKAAFLRERFGARGFCYYGNDAADLAVWQEAAQAYVVTDDPRLVERARQVCPDVTHLPAGKPAMARSILNALRPHQWVKNFLLFVPLLTSHRFNEPPLVISSALAFGIFCLLSSAVYLLNDAIDLDADRQHASKVRRPFASGDLSVAWALPLFFILAGAGLCFAAALGNEFLTVCAAYLGLTVLYSAVLKKLALLDVYALAALYTLRLVAGGAVTGIVISVWLAAFSIFIFLSLALCKRYTEIGELEPAAGAKINRRGYYATDAAFVLGQGLIFMGCATLVLAVYLSSSAVTLLYKTPSVLWLAVLVVSFWGGRLWLLASRREMHEDPVFFALKDRLSWVCLAMLITVFFAAISLN